jgi:hypothetical protein
MSRRPTLLAAATLAFLAAASLAAADTPPQKHVEVRYGQWRSSHIGGGGYVQRIVLCPSNPKRVYAWTDCCGIYRSDGVQRRVEICTVIVINDRGFVPPGITSFLAERNPQWEDAGEGARNEGHATPQ